MCESRIENHGVSRLTRNGKWFALSPMRIEVEKPFDLLIEPQNLNRLLAMSAWQNQQATVGLVGLVKRKPQC